MYPNLYYVVKDWFGVSWEQLKFLNMFGLMVAMGFVVAAVVLSHELKRREKQGLLSPREETITVGEAASLGELLANGLVGFIFGYKIFGLFFNKPAGINAQEYIFSKDGSLVSGILLGILLAGVKWWDKNKQKLASPERRNIRIWPHDRVGDIIIIGLVFGILGAKLFDNLENWDDFVKDPLGRIFSASGLTFYGGLIMAAIAICWYGAKKGIRVIHLVDSAAPALLIAYAVGRIGCQVAGDGDWGIQNSAYITDGNGKVQLAGPGDFSKSLERDSTYFINGSVFEKSATGQDINVIVTDRKYESLSKVPNASLRAPSFLPVWMFAYTYPGNVNKDGVRINGNVEEHNRALPLPVFPTPFYETIVCGVLFLLLMSIRKKIKIPGIIFGIYLIMNGLERFAIELIRVNNTYNIYGFHPTQAELISSALVISGILLIVIVRLRAKKLRPA